MYQHQCCLSSWEQLLREHELGATAPTQTPDTGALVCQTFVVGLWGVGVWGGEPVVVFHSLFIVKSKMVI